MVELVPALHMMYSPENSEGVNSSLAETPNMTVWGVAKTSASGIAHTSVECSLYNANA